jgi:hypothetical protein
MSGAWIFTILLAIFAMTQMGMGLAYVLGGLTYMASYLVWFPIEKLVGPRFANDAWPFWISSAIFAVALIKATTFPGRSFSIERGGTVVFLSIWGYLLFGWALVAAPHGKMFPSLPAIGFSN